MGYTFVVEKREPQWKLYGFALEDGRFRLGEEVVPGVVLAAEFEEVEEEQERACRQQGKISPSP